MAPKHGGGQRACASGFIVTHRRPRARAELPAVGFSGAWGLRVMEGHSMASLPMV